MLPHLLGRPVSLVRCPTGAAEDCFFQRHAFKGMPPRSRPSSTQLGGRDQILHLRRGRQGLPRAGPVRRRRVPHLGRRGASATWTSPTGSSSTSTPARASAGARWSRRPCTSAASWRRWAWCLRQDVRRQGRARRGADLPKRDWKQVHAATRAIAERIAATAPDTFTTTWARTTASGASSSTSTATPAAPRRSRPIRCGRAPPAGLDAARWAIWRPSTLRKI
jgi:bifunctional non-homologous end joining protein LigD